MIESLCFRPCTNTTLNQEGSISAENDPCFSQYLKSNALFLFMYIWLSAILKVHFGVGVNFVDWVVGVWTLGEEKILYNILASNPTIHLEIRLS